MPAARLAMLDRLAALTPSQTRRSEESQAFQQFSTPIALGFVASIAAALTPADLVLEPSAGTGLLAIFAEIDGASLALNELADSRAGLLDRLFPGLAVTRFDAAHIHDHLDAGNPAERRADEPAIFRGGACRGARRRRGAAPHRAPRWRGSPRAAAWLRSPAPISPPTIPPGATASCNCRSADVSCSPQPSTVASMPATAPPSTRG